MKIIQPFELLPCPFCGNKDLEWEVTTRYDDEESSYVRCRCGASVDTTRHQLKTEGVDCYGRRIYLPTGMYLRRSAIDLWNRRKSDEVSSAEIRELEAHIDRLGKRLEQLTRERDALRADMEIIYHWGTCKVCAHHKYNDYYGGKRCELAWDECQFEWRGVQEAEHEDI